MDIKLTFQDYNIIRAHLSLELNNIKKTGKIKWFTKYEILDVIIKLDKAHYGYFDKKDAQ